MSKVVVEEEDLLTKHRRERKELQAQIQFIKKACSKGDKKKKKEAAETIAKLEQELDERQTLEVQNSESVQSEEVTDISQDLGQTPENTEPAVNGLTRVTKAQRRRNKKAAEEREREVRIQVQAEENKHGPRVRESEQINEVLKSLGLKIHSIPADGDCLYCAVNHQLEATGREVLDVEELRKITADYMREHKDDFMPFMSHPDSDDRYTDEQFEEYCKKVEKNSFWGGQLEINALSSALKCPIKVIQASAPTTLQGEGFGGLPLVLTYHRHLYRLGEHYNSTATTE